jgi:hypothetical protein
MSAKAFLFGEAARHKIIDGVDVLADAVKLTRQSASSIASLPPTDDGLNVARAPDS